MAQEHRKNHKALTPKERVLLAMDGGKPDQIPVAMMTDWDYTVRAGGGDPYDWMYGGFDRRLDLELRALRRHQGSAYFYYWPGRRADQPPRLLEADGRRYVVDAVSGENKELPPLGPTAQAGYYFLLPIVVLMWCLVVERLSPALSAYWATMLLIFIVLTQRPLKGLFRKQTGEQFAFKTGFNDMITGFVNGARNMIGIGVATSAAGIVVGTVADST